MFERVFAALESANLADKYMTKFIEQDVTDEVVECCLENPEDLDKLICKMGHRFRFVSHFRKTGTSNSQNLKVESTFSYFSAQNPTIPTTTAIAATPKTDFKTSAQNSYDKSLKLYLSKMDELFSPPGFFLDESTLLEKHQENRFKVVQDCTNRLTTVEIKPAGGEIDHVQHVKLEPENVEILNVKKSELLSEIDKKYEEYRIKNQVKKSNFISKVREAEKMYIDKMTKALENSTEENENDNENENEAHLKKKEKEVNQLMMKFLHADFQNPSVKSSVIDELTGELQKSLKKWFEHHLKLTQLKMEENEAFLNRIFNNSKNYYHGQMEKEMSSQNFIEPSKLVEISKNISDACLKMFKEQNPDLKLTPSQTKQIDNWMKTMYKKYEDQNLLRRPTPSFAIGIDLGTTNSCVAVYRNGKVEVIYNENGNKTTPSFVCFQEDDSSSVSVGDYAKDQSYRNPENTIFDSKRLIGRNFGDQKVQESIKTWSFDVINDQEKPKILIRLLEKNSDFEELTPPTKRRKTANSKQNEKVVFKNYHCEEISGLVLKKMKKIAEEYLGVEVKDAVITVPALFNDYQRQATKDAGEIAGLNVLRIINEPTAAAIAYNLHRKDELKRNVLVFDLGGGTLDVVVLQINKGEITVKSVHGDNHLGGQDFDTEMIKYCIDSFQTTNRINLARDQDSKNEKKRFDASSRLRRIRNECERQKKALSSTTKIIIGINAIESKPKLLDLHVPFTRDLFESLNKKHFDRCLEIVQLALDEAKMNKSEINDIVLVGGSTRIPKIQKMLSDFFDGEKTLCKSINPDEAVAEGAAIQACILSGQEVGGVDGMKLKLNDVTPFSIGIEDSKGKFRVQIPKNSSLPCSVTRRWLTSVDNQRRVEFKIFEGENPFTCDNNLLGTYFLDGIPLNKAGEEKLPTTTTINEEGILHVKSTCWSNGTSNGLTVKTFNNRMTRKEIEDAKISLNSLMA